MQPLEYLMHQDNQGSAAMLFLKARKRMNFAGRVVIITGGSRGLGLLMARMFRKEGARVAILARNEDELQRAAMSLDPHKRRVLPIVCDVAKAVNVTSAIDIVLRHFGRVDVLINNAGV